MEYVQFKSCGYVYVLLDDVDREKVSAHVEVQAAPTILRPIDDVYEGERVQLFSIVRDKLFKGLRTIEESGPGSRSNGNTKSAHIETIALVADFGDLFLDEADVRRRSL